MCTEWCGGRELNFRRGCLAKSIPYSRSIPCRRASVEHPSICWWSIVPLVVYDSLYHDSKAWSLAWPALSLRQFKTSQAVFSVWRWEMHFYFLQFRKSWVRRFEWFWQSFQSLKCLEQFQVSGSLAQVQLLPWLWTWDWILVRRTPCDMVRTCGTGEPEHEKYGKLQDHQIIT